MIVKFSKENFIYKKLQQKIHLLLNRLCYEDSTVLTISQTYPNPI